MKIAFLHLGDLHLSSNDNAKPQRIQAAAESLQVFDGLDGLVIIFAGDIATSGKSNEYKVGQQFIGRLVDSVSKKYRLDSKNIKILLVPGNHDIDYGTSPRFSADEIHAFSPAERLVHLNQEIIRQKNFFSFADRNGCFFANNMGSGMEWSQLITRKILHFSNNYRIEANLINSAPFSINKDDGLHYLPADAMAQLCSPSNADLSVAVMHHSPDWFGFAEKKELVTAIAQRCSIAFYGHEHILDAQHICYSEGTSILVQQGGAWWQQSAIMRSEYNASMFDTDNRNYRLERFSWESNVGRFVGLRAFDGALSEKPLSALALRCQNIYIEEILRDTKHQVSAKISDYFIFPSLRIDATKEYANGKAINTMQELIYFLSKNNYLAFVGGSSSGKTTIMKMLFSELHRHYITIFCSLDDINGRKPENILRGVIENIYGSGSYALFQQEPKDKKVIIIDDVHRIPERHLEKFLKNLELSFGYIVIATADTGDFDIVKAVKDSLSSRNSFRKLSISRFYAEKRKELINKIVSIKVQASPQRQDELAKELDTCLNNHKLGFRVDVDFIAQFSNYYCTHIGELAHTDTTVFSKVFEASIEQAISESLHKKNESISDIMVALSEVAHDIHFSQSYPISPIDIETSINTYCEYFDNRYLTPARFLEIAEKSNLLIKAGEGIKYRFKSKDHLAYFIAKALNRKFHDTGDQANLQLVVEHSCFGINADILMYLTYISDNVNIPRLLLRQAEKHVESWGEFDISNKGLSYLSSVVEEKALPPQAAEREAASKQDSKIEEHLDNETIETLDIYDYDINDIEKINYQIIRAFLQLRILARSLSAFVSLLPARDKQELVTATFQMPNKIFKQWADSIDNSISGLIDGIMEWQESPDFAGKKITREKVLRYFQSISTSLLLNLYYLVTRFGVTPATIDHLAQQDFIRDNLNYRIERLMFYEKVDEYRSLVAEAEDILKDCKDNMVKNMVVSIIRHMLIHSDKMPSNERQRLLGAHFSQQSQKGILASRSNALKGNVG